MIIQKLLLTHQQAAFHAGSRSQCNPNRPILAIGLGGAGIEALARFKNQVTHGLHPDDPDAALPRYSSIRFLGIDTDRTTISRHYQNGPLTQEELLALHCPDTAALLPTLVMNPTVYSWLDTDTFRSLPRGLHFASGYRQLGRVLLFLQLESVYNRLCSLLNALHNALPGMTPEVHLFAGLSGGTGSGCFIDLCYLLRTIAQNWGMPLRIIGYFFTPDVLLSKINIHQDIALRDQNTANGYAALKELDYLQALEKNHDRFTQQYPNGYVVDTQAKPVDTCYLLTAVDNGGAVAPNAYQKAMETAVSWAMLYATDLQPSAMGMVSIGGFLDNMHLFSRTDRSHGALDLYHIPGAAETEPSAEEALQHLALIYCERFRQLTKDPGTVSSDELRDVIEGSGLIFAQLLNEPMKTLPGLKLPDDVRQQLKSQGPVPHGQLPATWAIPGNNWLAQCQQLLTQWLRVRFRPPEEDPEKADPEVFADRIFARLHQLCLTPDRGPAYALRMLRGEGPCILWHLEGALTQAMEQIRLQAASLELAQDHMTRAAEDFYSCNIFQQRRTFEAYLYAVDCYLHEKLKLWYLEQLPQHLKQLLAHLEQLQKSHFESLRAVLDSLYDTFTENDHILRNRVRLGVPIVPVSTRKPRLTGLVQALPDRQVVEGLVRTVLKKPLPPCGEACHPELPEILLEYFRQLFCDEAYKPLDSLLEECFPLSVGNLPQMISLTENNILRQTHTQATPVFFQNILHSTAHAAQVGFVLTGAPSIAWDSAQGFISHNPHLHCAHHTRTAGDRISVLQLQACTPLYSWGMWESMTTAYERIKTSGFGKLLHLYSGEALNWAQYLPDPTPHSLNRAAVPTEAQRLFTWATEQGLIQNPTATRWELRLTGPLPLEDLDPATLYVNGQLHQPAHQHMLEQLHKRIDRSNRECRVLYLADYTGPQEDTQQVLLDYFHLSPVLQNAVRTEREKAENSRKLLETLQEMERSEISYEKDLRRYCELLFLGFLSFPMTPEDPKGVYCRFYDRNGVLVDHRFASPGNAALYEGFLAYRNTDPNQSPRMELEALCEEALCQSQSMEDLCVTYDFLQCWNDPQQSILGCTQPLPPETRDDARRFYENLLRQALRFKQWSPIWPNDIIRAATKPRLRYEVTPW